MNGIVLKPGSTFLDIGANIGYHSFLAATRVRESGRVISIEMNPTNCALFRAGMAANGFTNIRLHETAVGETEGELQFCVPTNTGNGMVINHSLQMEMNAAPGHFSNPTTVSSLPVDVLIQPGLRIDLLKIDIEGSELNAFRGMARILSESQPGIVFEFCPILLKKVGGCEPTELLNYLREHGYEFRHVHRKSSRSDSALANREIIDRAEQSKLIDIYATHRSD